MFLVDELSVEVAERESGKRKVLDDDGMGKDEGGVGREVRLERVRERQAQDR